MRQEVGPAAEGAFKLPAEGINFEDVERNLITQAMEQTDYNITKAAKLLGLTFRTLQYRLEKVRHQETRRPRRRGRGIATKGKGTGDSKPGLSSAKGVHWHMAATTYSACKCPGSCRRSNGVIRAFHGGQS